LPNRGKPACGVNYLRSSGDDNWVFYPFEMDMAKQNYEQKKDREIFYLERWAGVRYKAGVDLVL